MSISLILFAEDDPAGVADLRGFEEPSPANAVEVVRNGTEDLDPLFRRGP